MQQKAGELQGWWSGEEGLPGPSLGRAPALDRWALRMKAHIWRRAWVPAAGGLSAPRSPTHKTAPAPQRGPRASEILSQVPSWDWPLLVSEQGGDSPDCLQGAWHVVLLKENLTVISLEAAGACGQSPRQPPWRVLSDPWPKGAGAASLGLTFSTLMLAFALVSMNLIP